MSFAKEFVVFPRQESEIEESQYVPYPSLGHEFGILFGFVGAFIVFTVLFYLWWLTFLKREESKERTRVEDLRSRGLLKEGPYATGDAGKVQQ
ncbi:hypothetical protein BDY21DRAFT_343785 [Lineolata rhizophorae]|uniref:Uncharacterized protein n=1 Tax=Lineolata rhizophorae TaxID=578093 RepID=A0A6A6P0S2_9PEZI|nr:hypothetical protein BDY21DRAFT_343785 [Lineolata rhizophorae]